MKKKDYRYFNVPIGGGGYVTGIEFDKSNKNLLYIRTDIGGLYRFDSEINQWISLIDFVTENDLAETYPAAVCSENGVLYSVCGSNEDNSKLCISYDYGKSFEYKKIPAMVHGNYSGRGTGSRLVVKNGTIYYASSHDGILVSHDYGDSWKKIFPNNEKSITFIHVSNDGNTVITATAGLENMSSENMRGHSLYVSYDSMKTFEKLSQPENKLHNNIPLSGMVGHRISTDGKYYYITMNCSGNAKWNIPFSYSCDAGCLNSGIILRYKIDSYGHLGTYEDITPENDYSCGYGGICAEHGVLVATTMYHSSERIYISENFGENWRVILDGLDGISFNTPYMRPENNENHSLIHWMSDIKINPHNKNEAWFNTGTGVFKTGNLLSEKPHFYDSCDGIEETVHLNIYSPSTGDVELIDILGDLGGFAFEDITRHALNTFADENNLRYITCINADYPDENPKLVIATARGNWVGSTKGGLIISHSYGKCFEERPSLPFGLTEKLDNLFHKIECPNVNAGWVAVSADGKNVVWCVADKGNILPADCVVYSNDVCKTYGVSVFKKINGEFFNGHIKVFSDRLNSDIFYAFGSEGNFFVSHDKGAVFKQIECELPDVDFGRIDGNNKTDIKPDNGKSGVFYITAAGGLYKLKYKNDTCTTQKLSNDNDIIRRIGLGILHEKYLGDDKMLYINGWINGEYGFYYSADDGKNWVRINNENQMFGEINAIEGDSRIKGKFYLATGSRGLICGEPCL